jgi:TolB-like protein
MVWRGWPSDPKLALSKVTAAADLARNVPSVRETLPEPARFSIVVLPFTDLGPDKDQEHFSDVLTAELIATLTGMPGVRVVSCTSAYYFKGTSGDVRSVCKQLDVGMVLEANVRRAGRQVQVNAQLINATEGYQLWSETFDGEVKDVLSFQRGLAKAITETMSVDIGRAGEVSHSGQYTLALG